MVAVLRDEDRYVRVLVLFDLSQVSRDVMQACVGREGLIAHTRS